MDWNWQERRVRLSVGELARFSIFVDAGPATGRWRAELGSHWHGVLREQAEAEDPAWSFEQPVRGDLQQEGWSFALNGRIDQLWTQPGRAHLREVKTIRMDLPTAEDTLRDTYPQYCHQAMLYRFLLAGDIPEIRTELLFLDIQTGLSQSLFLGELDWHRLRAHLATVARTLEARREHFSRLRNMAVPRPFRKWRPGQATARGALRRHIEAGASLLFEAPTGFGKTALVVEQAMAQLARGEIERAVFLTGRNTGQAAFLEHLKAVRREVPQLTVHALRSRADHTLDPELEAAMSHSEIIERWNQSHLSAEAMLHEDILDLPALRRLGQSEGLPPWAITRFLLPFADFWIADLNYVFDPAVARVFDATPTWNPARTLLVIDEAHNLADRVAACHSHELSEAVVARAYTEFHFGAYNHPLVRLLDQLLTRLRRTRPSEALDPPEEAELLGLLREIAAACDAANWPADTLSEASRNWLFDLPYLIESWDDPRLPMHIHAPAKGVLRLVCLDASEVIAEKLSPFRQALLMSATLRPWTDLRTALGLQVQPQFRELVGESPWLQGCFEVCVDARIDTRFTQRQKHLPATVRVLGSTAVDASGCTVAFFPSYKYAHSVMEGVRLDFPILRCALQPRDLVLEEQQAFLETALLTTDLLFLVLGSRFSEGIDALGGRVATVVVVSPALPEVNAVQKAKEAAFPNRGEAFRHLYCVPGMRKIQQALGRLVRSPEHRARVLLVGKRFTEPAYLDLLPDYLQPGHTVYTESAFSENWLKTR